jgi:hypothetical protein
VLIISCCCCSSFCLKLRAQQIKKRMGFDQASESRSPIGDGYWGWVIPGCLRHEWLRTRRSKTSHKNPCDARKDIFEGWCQSINTLGNIRYNSTISSVKGKLIKNNMLASLALQYIVSRGTSPQLINRKQQANSLLHL